MIHQYIGFILEDGEYAVPIMSVQEIIKIPFIRHVPESPSYVQGVSNLRGKIVTIVNLKKILSKDETVDPQKVIVLAVGKVVFGILIDDITGVIKVTDDQIDRNVDIIGEGSKITGVAKTNNKLIVLLNEKKMVPHLNNLSLIEEEIISYKENENNEIEVVKKIEGIGGQINITEKLNVEEFYKKYGANKEKDDQRLIIVEDIIKFMEAISENDFETADKIMESIMQKSQNELFKEVGKVSKKLNDSLKTFKASLDPKLKDIAEQQMPRAVDQLEAVIEKTESAATQTMDIVEKYVLQMDDVASKIRELGDFENKVIFENEEDKINYLNNIEFLKQFKNALEDDLTNILTAQSFQDITGQTIKKVIKLVGDLEIELIKLITTFGFKDDSKEKEIKTVIDSGGAISQDDIDNLLDELGF